MARRRCISVDFFNNDEFLDLSASSRMLYTYFILGADDEGFIVNPKTIMRICGASQKDFEELLDYEFVLDVDDVYVIKHWFWHDQISPSKRHETQYIRQKEKLRVNDYEKVYEYNDLDM